MARQPSNFVPRMYRQSPKIHRASSPLIPLSTRYPVQWPRKAPPMTPTRHSSMGLAKTHSRNDPNPGEPGQVGGVRSALLERTESGKPKATLLHNQVRLQELLQVTRSNIAFQRGKSSENGNSTHRAIFCQLADGAPLPQLGLRNTPLTLRSVPAVNSNAW